MELTVRELKRLLGLFPDEYPVEFQPVETPDGKTYRLSFYRFKDRGFCHVEWNPIDDEDEIKSHL